MLHTGIVFFSKITWKHFLYFLLSCIVLFLLLNAFFPLKIKVKYSQLILARDSTVLHTYLTPDEKWRLKTELYEIIPNLSKAIIYKEDKYFYYHFGINPVSVFRAFFNNIFHLKTTSGASTITMQVARLLEPKSRSYGNKLWEMFRALQLEWQYSKAEILQMYLNLVPYGGNIEGVKSAALLYFDQMPNKLSLAQIVTLAIIPNRPTSLVIGKNNALIARERNKWLLRFKRSGLFPPQLIEGALEESLLAQRLAAPKKAPHFSLRLRNLYPQSHSLFSTLHPLNQEKVGQLAFNYIQRLKPLQVYNVSVIVMNNQNRQVEVYLGSADFQDKEHEGEVDGIQGIRSPGSTLKPLVYALAMDKGFITPKTILNDVPSDFSGFEPENFYKKFSGPVTVEQALSQSLNVTAVQTLEQVGLKAFIQKLKMARFRQIARDEKKLGLSMILGGCGVNLEELSNLFATFANQGLYQEASYLMQDSKRTQHKLISPEAGFAITQILTKAQRPDLPQQFENALHIPKVAWKTGTSYGRRDAWSIGYNARYTVGVWVGNFSGEGVNDLIGAELATPLLFQIFNTIDYDSPAHWFEPPKDLKVRWVCSETGLPPNTYCRDQVIDYFIPLVSDTRLCNHSKEVMVSPDERYAFCMTCVQDKKHKIVSYPHLSPSLSAFYEARGIAFKKIPPHHPECTRIFEDQREAPEITSPSSDKEYLIDRDDPSELQLSCKVAPDVKNVYWYINEEFYQAAKANQAIFFKPSQGFIKISCSDDKGRNSNINIRVFYE
ncbi:MAG: penicillin-binding protein 1C [Microscillaceae bacterium]|nr:penicillin-binding protein 1C [Microscillaceae bacterium]